MTELDDVLEGRFPWVVLFEQALAHEAAERFDEAAAGYVEAIRSNPNLRDRYVHLHEVHLHRGAIDAAWCAVACLALLPDLHPSEEQFLADHAPRRLPANVRPLDAAGWRALRHPDEGGFPETLPLIVDPPPPRVPHDVFAWAAYALGFPMRDEVPPLAPRTSLDARAGGVTLREALFLAGRELTRRTYGGTIRIVEHTALRAGLLLVGDVNVARNALRAEFAPGMRLTGITGIPELMMFAVSEDFTRLRKHIGLSIEQADDAG